MILPLARLIQEAFEQRLLTKCTMPVSVCRLQYLSTLMPSVLELGRNWHNYWLCRI